MWFEEHNNNLSIVLCKQSGLEAQITSYGLSKSAGEAIMLQIENRFEHRIAQSV
jgi:hypothetical protein